MAIYAPGIRKGKYVVHTKRDVIAVLQLTAMVDLFTVLVVFLLQNYAVTDQILPIAEEIILPQAKEVRELKPSHVVILSKGEVQLNQEALGSLSSHTSKDQWVFQPLKEKIIKVLADSQAGVDNFLITQLKKMNLQDKDEDYVKKTPFRVTIQAAESTEFLEIKKIMYTLTEAGVKEMNFAVIKTPESIVTN